MALRTLQLCIVFTIGLSVNYPTLASSDSVLSVLGAALGWPVLISPPSTIRIRSPEQDEVIGVRGQSVVLRCPIETIQSSSNVTFAWLHNDVPINFSNETRRQIIEHNGSLNITKVAGKKSASLEGQYRCVASNHIGTVVTEAISLKISTFARSFIAEPINMTVTEGDNVMFPCRINSVPEPTVYWERNKSPIEYSYRYVQLQSGSLLIKNIQISDAGAFQCSVTNRLQKKPRISSIGNLVINLTKGLSKISPTSPQFVPLNMSQTINTKFGQNVTLHCIANGWPKPVVSWKYKINENATKYVSNSSTFKMYNITVKEAGIYICSAKNRLGQKTQEWVIQMAPRFNETPTSIKFPSPQTIRFNCSANGYPTPSIRWLKDGNPLYMDRRITIKGKMLVLAATRRNDSGFYECIAENNAGEARSVAQVTIIQKEHHLLSPINLQCRPFSVDEVCLSWDSSVLSNLSIIGYSVHFYPTLNGSEVSAVSQNKHILIQNLKPNTSYTFYVRNYNVAVASEPSAFINCTGEPIGKRKIDFNVKSPNSMLVTWSPLINDTPCGGNTEYKIQWRRHDRPSNSAKVLEANVREYVIKDLILNQKYEVRILADPKLVDENIPWISFTMPKVKAKNAGQNGTSSVESNEFIYTDSALSNDTFYSRLINPPTQVDAVPISESVINVTWSPAKIDLENDDVAFYMICYMEVNSKKTCDDGVNFVKSYTNEVKITGLKPFSQYEFKVRTHSINEKYGSFSQVVECRTLEGIPSEVRNLHLKLIAVSKVMIIWEQPSQVNGVLKHYIIKYTTRSSLPTDQWSLEIVPPFQNTFSLPDFKTEDSYTVHVCAVNNAGSSQPASLIVPNMSRPARHPSIPDDPEEKPNQTFGILIGMLIAITCVVCCILHLLWRRRCVKLFHGADHRRSPGHRSGVQSTNGHSSNTTRSSEPVVTMHTLRYPAAPRSDVDSTCSVTLGEDGEAHEMQCLMMENELISLPPHIPPVMGIHLDTKGSATYPNGHINGLKYPVMSNGRIANGIVRITENPQYEPATYDRNENGHGNNNQMSDRVQNDSCILDDTKHSGFNMIIDSSTFDVTQLTSLDSSIRPASLRNISPILDPNG